MTYEKEGSLRPSGDFIQERRYLTSVSPKTIKFYGCSFKAFDGALELEAAKRRVAELRERGVKPVSINTYLTCINTYWKWCGLDWKIKPLKVESRLVQTLTPIELRKLFDYRPAGINLRRAWILANVIADCGLRASETLRLTNEDVELEQMFFKVLGKGGKHRLVPFSVELRKRVWRYLNDFKRHYLINEGNSPPRFYLFGTKHNTTVSVRNFERDLKSLGKCIGLPQLRPHLLRHCFATNWLRNGGDIYQLSRILGHANISTTTIYLRSLGIDDLSRSHQKFSPLSQHSH